jgi:hypothetical protein
LDDVFTGLVTAMLVPVVVYVAGHDEPDEKVAPSVVTEVRAPVAVRVIELPPPATPVVALGVPETAVVYTPLPATALVLTVVPA